MAFSDFLLGARAKASNAAKALDTLRETFAAEGATKSEWQRACHDIPERSFHRAAKMLGERGLVQRFGTHWRVIGGGK